MGSSKGRLAVDVQDAAEAREERPALLAGVQSRHGSYPICAFLVSLVCGCGCFGLVWSIGARAYAHLLI